MVFKESPQILTSLSNCYTCICHFSVYVFAVYTSYFCVKEKHIAAVMHCQSDLCCTVWWSWRGRHPNKGEEWERNSTLRLKLPVQNPAQHGQSPGFEETQRDTTQLLQTILIHWPFQYNKLIRRSCCMLFSSNALNIGKTKMHLMKTENNRN